MTPRARQLWAGIIVCLLGISSIGPAAAFPGHTAANFLRIGVGPRAIALGESYVAVADDVSAIYYNPAGLSMLRRQEASFMHNEHFDGVRQEWGAYAFPHARIGTLAAAFTFVGVSAFDAYTELDEPDGEVSASDMAATGAYAWEFGKKQRLAFGVAGKVIQSRLANYKAETGALDGGIMWLSDDEGTWRLGAAVRDLGYKMKFVEESFLLPMSFHAGVSYNSVLPHPWDALSWTGTVEVAAPYDREPSISGGVELRLPIELYLRAGYRSNQDSGLGVSGGFGVRSLEKGFSDRWPELQLDYAFVDFGDLNQTHRVAVTIRFGPDKSGTFIFKKRAEELRFY